MNVSVFRWTTGLDRFKQHQRSFIVRSFVQVQRRKRAKMKLLESSRFEAINSALSITTGDSKIIGRWGSLPSFPRIFAFFLMSLFSGSRAIPAKWPGMINSSIKDSIRSKESLRTIFKLCHHRRLLLGHRQRNVTAGIMPVLFSPFLCST